MVLGLPDPRDAAGDAVATVTGAADSAADAVTDTASDAASWERETRDERYSVYDEWLAFGYLPGGDDPFVDPRDASLPSFDVGLLGGGGGAPPDRQQPEGPSQAMVAAIVGGLAVLVLVVFG